jgi:hypothetical protein
VIDESSLKTFFSLKNQELSDYACAKFCLVKIHLKTFYQTVDTVIRQFLVFQRKKIAIHFILLGEVIEKLQIYKNK